MLELNLPPKCLKVSPWYGNDVFMLLQNVSKFLRDTSFYEISVSCAQLVIDPHEQTLDHTVFRLYTNQVISPACTA
jgi:hypothetical protein